MMNPHVRMIESDEHTITLELVDTQGAMTLLKISRKSLPDFIARIEWALVAKGKVN